MKKPVRLLLVAAGSLGVVILIALGLVLHSGVQTWAARRALASQSGLKAHLGLLNAGFRNVDLTDLQFERDGAVIRLPTFHAELSVIDAGMNEKVNIRHLVAKGWTLDLTKFDAAVIGQKVVVNPRAASGRAAAFSLLSAAYAADPANAVPAAVGQVFQGVFAQTTLPVELSLDGVELEGDVLLPTKPGVDLARAHVTIQGGGFSAGREGALTFVVDVSLAGSDLPVNAVTVQGRIAATMDTPRTFSRLATKADAAASGPKFPHTVRLATEAVASRDAGGENYSLSVAGDGRPLAGMQAAFPQVTHKLAGTWTLDLSDTDLAPFSLGRSLPTFTAVGQGRFDTDPTFGEIHTSGKISATADRLAMVRPEFAGVGAVKLSAEFDLSHRGDALRVERLTCALTGAEPILHAQSLQAFEFNPRTGDLKVADPTRELLDLVLDGLPIAWAKPFLNQTKVTGGAVRGEFLASARNGGATLRPKGALAVAGISIEQAGQALVSEADISAVASADYTPQGWQVELAPLAVRTHDTGLINLEAKAGRLAGKDQPLKATGKFSVNLPALLAQPVVGASGRLTGGEATGIFSASIDPQQGRQIEASLTLANLAADPRVTTAKLPTVSADVRASVAASGGPMVLQVPVLIEREGRKSDLTLTGTLTLAPGVLGVNAQVASTLLVVSDAMLLLPLAPPTPAEGVVAGRPTVAPKASPTLAPWAGLSGQISLALKKVVYAEAFEASNVTGRLKLDAGTVKLENAGAGLGDGSEAKVSGRLTFDGKALEPFALVADLALSEFDPAPLFRALNPGQPATVEGKFTVTSKLTGRARTIPALAETTQGDFQLTSKGGIFRGMPANVATKAEATGKFAAAAAAVGNAIGAVTGKKDASDLASKAQAVSEICKLLSPIQYDQVSVTLSSDESLNTVMKDFTLLAPEMRLTGSGQVSYQPGVKLLDEALAMDFKLRARGHTADVLKYLGKLDAQPDELGYAGSTLPLRVGGTLAQPDTSEINNTLMNLTVEKSGVLEKAGDFLNIFRGGK
jgi:hypothetical protein